MRKRLPNRRNSATVEVFWNDERYHVTYSRYDMIGPIAEVFICGPKRGSNADAISYSIGTVLSIALQRGVPLEELAHSVCRLPDGSPADIVGTVLDALITEDTLFKQEFAA